jgi:hypothetical protein
MKSTALLLVLLALALPLSAAMKQANAEASMNSLSESYVKLVLALGEHDADYVDAYYGPPEWREEVRKEKPSLETIAERARILTVGLSRVAPSTDPLLQLRREYLRKQTAALVARVEMLNGRKMTFDEESKALYDAVAPHHDEAYFQKLVAALEKELPGKGALIDRLETYRKGFVIPNEKLDVVFKKAIDGCRQRTLAHMELPKGESFTVEYVKNKSWSGYNWYKGHSTSLIQVNTDLPIFIDRAIDLACHEGYPGHHVYNALLEKNLVEGHGWKEFTVYPLFSPQSLIAEGSANFGIDMAFPGDERATWEKKNLFPLAGLDPATAERYYRINALLAKLGYAGNEAARDYLDGKMTADQAVEWLTRYSLSAPERARQRIKFIDQYRSYVINYNLGKDLVRQYIDAQGGNDLRNRWNAFRDLLSSPRLPSGLATK